MLIAGFVVFFSSLQFLVGRSKEVSPLCNVVAGPLTGEWEDECVSKVILLLVLGTGASNFALGGRATPRESKQFDGTMGYPGEDVQLLTLL